LIRLSLLMLAVLLAGCASHVDPTPIGDKAQNEISAITVDLSAGSVSLNKSLAALSATQPSVPMAIQGINEAQSDIQQAMASATKVSKSIGTLATSYDALAKKWNALQDDWLGPKAHRTIGWLVAAAILFVIGIILLQCVPAIAAFSPILGTLSKIVGHVLSLGTAGLTKLLSKGLTAVVTKTASVVSSAPTPAVKA
jgi:hypothetical protein